MIHGSMMTAARSRLASDLRPCLGASIGRAFRTFPGQFSIEQPTNVLSMASILVSS